MAELVVRAETAADWDAVRIVHQEAFPKENVSGLVERIRASDRFVPELSLVAEEFPADPASGGHGAVIGHVLLSYVDLVGEQREPQRVLCLSPLAVRPARQRRGVGASLTRAALRRAEDRDEPAVILEGIPAYYPRFGFEPADPLGIVFPHTVPRPAAMVRRLRQYTPRVRGRVVYPAAYDVLEKTPPA